MDPRQVALKEAYETSLKRAQGLWSSFNKAKEEAETKGLDLTDDKHFKPLKAKSEEYEAAAQSATKARTAYLAFLERGSQGTKVGPDGGWPSTWSDPLIEKYGAKAFDVSAGGLTVSGQAFDETIRALPQRRLIVQSLLPRKEIDTDKFGYLRNTVFTNNAAEVSPAAVKPTSVISVERIEDTVRMVAHLSEALDRGLLRDLDTVKTFIDETMRMGLLLRIDSQILNGNGTPPNMRGILQTSGILTQAKGADPAPDAIYKGLIKLENQANPYEATGIVVHPTDWSTIRLSKSTDGQYLLGDLTDDPEGRLFGKDVVITQAIAQGTALCGDFTKAVVYSREESVIEWFSSGGLGAAGVELASRNLMVCRAESAVGLAVERPAAFCTVTGL